MKNQPSTPIATPPRKQNSSVHRIVIVTIAFIAATLASRAVAEASWVAPSSAAAKKNPFAGNAGAAAAGKQVFMTTCAPCHGQSGRGDGPAAAALNPKPANYTTSAISGESDGALFWKLSEGRGAMVAFKGSLTEKQRWELITYIRTLQGKR